MFTAAILAAVLIHSVILTDPVSPKQTGQYDIYSNGVKKGFSRYFYDSKGNLILDGDSGLGIASKGTFTYEAGRPQRVVFEVTGMNPTKFAYVIKDDHLKRTDKLGETTQPNKKSNRFYYPTQPALLKYLLDQFPAGARNFQKLPALDLLTGKPRDITAELYKTESRRIHGNTLRLRLWRMNSLPTTEAVIYTDESNHPLYWWVPARQFEMVLQGYEEIRPATRYEKSVSPPIYKVKVDNDVRVPMRDGAKLGADVYRPDAPGRFPVLLQRTCYDRSEFGLSDGEFYAQRGYVYVTQHVRGRGSSDGEFEPFIHETNDGYDTVVWCADQPWFSGKVGTLGASYNGYCEWMTAKARPKGLTAMISTVPMAGPPDGAPWAGGSYYPGDMLGWFGLLRDKAKTQPFNDDLTGAINTLPLTDADSLLFGRHISAYDYWLEQDKLNERVKQATYRDEMDSIDLPVLHVSGWLDSTGVGTRLNYMQMVANGRKNQKLVWGPWTHFTNRESIAGVRDFGPEAYIDLKMLYLRWFDRWLKDRKNGIDKEPSTSVYLVGEHRWEQNEHWPSKSMSPQKWYLHPSSKEDVAGTLSLAQPKNDKPNRFSYDPSQYAYSQKNFQSFFYGLLGGDDLSGLCSTSARDRLIYETEPLKQTLRLCGPVRGMLSASTSAVDTDWVMALMDVFPDKRAVTIGCGMVRARFRDSFTTPSLLEPNKKYDYDIDMWQTGVSIPVGHSLRIVVLSTLFPDKDRNLNTGESIAFGKRMVKANQTVYHEPGHASYVLLPVLPIS